MTADDKFALRLGALRLARRRGNIRDGAWAAARLRLRGVILTPGEARFAHEMVERYGHALRLARQGRVVALGPALVPGPKVRARPERRRWLLAAIAVAALVVGSLLLLRPVVESNEAAGGGLPVAAAVPAPTYPPLRGRSRDLAAAVPVATPEPTVAPTEAPSPTAAPTAAPTAKPGVSGGGTGSGGNGGGTGGGSGNGTGSGGGAASPRPTATPSPTPTPDPFTRMILRGRVVDARTGRGLPLVCVAPGLNTCAGDAVAFTDAGGYWQLVLSIGQQWDIKFLKVGYFAAEIRVPSQAGINYFPDIYLRPNQ